MRRSQPFSLSILLLAFSLTLMACSPSEKETEEQTQTDEYRQTNEASPDDSSQEEVVIPDGSRKGKLHIEVDVQQDGGNNEGGVESHWTSSINVVSEVDVIVAEDLRPYVSEGPLPDTDVGQYEPFTLIDPNAPTVKSSAVVYTATQTINADDMKSSHQGEFRGVVDRVYLQSLNPSLFGPGYEAYLKIDITGQLKSREILSAAGQTPITNETDKETTEEIIYSLHPVPNADKLNDYPYLPEGIDEATRESITKQNLETLSLLNEIYKDALPVQSQIRAGMKSEATKDSLTMTYEYNGNKEVGHAVMIGVSGGMATNNKVKITIQLTADE